MGNIFKTPNIYSEWIECFNYLKKNRVDSDFIDMLKQGGLSGDEQTMARFEKQLINLINTLINRRISRFIKEFNYLIEFNEIEGLVPLFRCLKKDMSYYMFFYELDFLTLNTKLQLTKSIETQVEGILNKILGQIRKQVVECNNLDLDNALYQIKRIKMFS